MTRPGRPDRRSPITGDDGACLVAVGADDDLHADVVMVSVRQSSLSAVSDMTCS
jgi:hypothetical protein